MKVTREQTAENREKLVRSAGRLIREKGIDGVGVAEICAQAGLTHGVLYAQFGSKDALVAEALADGLARGEARVAEHATRKTPTLADYLAYYLSTKNRDDLAGSCPMAASASEIARQSEMVSSRFADGFDGMVTTISATLEPAHHQRALAITISAAMIGALAVARGVAKSRPDFSEEILAAVALVAPSISLEPTRRSRRATGSPGKPAGLRKKKNSRVRST